MTHMIRRLAFDVSFLGVFLVFGWLWAAFFAFAGLLIFPMFWEAVALGVVLDALSGDRLFTVISVVLFVALRRARAHVRPRIYEAALSR